NALPLYTYHPGAKPVALTAGLVHRLPSPDSKGGEARKSWDKPIDWNTLEVICYNDTITVNLNGQRVNKLTKVGRTQGHIAIGLQGAEFFVRRLELSPAG